MITPEHLKTLTDFEVAALRAPYNLADGHARQFGSRALAYLRDLPRQLEGPTFSMESEEEAFLDAFFCAAGQKTARDHRTILVPTASISIEIVANYLRLARRSVSLIEPCFDNIALILRRHGVPLTPLSEEQLQAGAAEIRKLVLGTQEDAIFLVLPNNPTGTLIDRVCFQTLASSCAEVGKLLIIDFSFRFVAPELEAYDQYEILAQSGCEFITVEDTGKTWNSLELKLSPVVASDLPAIHLQRIHREIFLQISPVAPMLLHSLLKHEDPEGPNTEVRNLIRNNRQILHAAISNTAVQVDRTSMSSVEWLRITDPSMTGERLVKNLEVRGVRVLPGDHFFWSNRRAAPYIRVALSRDTDYFRDAIDAFARALRHLPSE